MYTFPFSFGEIPRLYIPHVTCLKTHEWVIKMYIGIKTINFIPRNDIFDYFTQKLLDKCKNKYFLSIYAENETEDIVFAQKLQKNAYFSYAEYHG